MSHTAFCAPMDASAERQYANDGASNSVCVSEAPKRQ